MKKTFSSIEYRDNEHQIVIVGVDKEDVDAIKRYLERVIRAEPGEHSKLRVPGKKKWEE